MYINLTTFLGLINPVLNFLNFLIDWVLLSYKPLSDEKNVQCTEYIALTTVNDEIFSCVSFAEESVRSNLPTCLHGKGPNKSS